MEEVTPVEELRYESIEPQYRSVQISLTCIGYVILAALALFFLLLDNSLWVILCESAILVTMLINLIIVRKAWLFKGYALRENDLSFRSGIVFPTITTIPYLKVQQVSVKQNPISKLFNLYAVEVVNGAQAMASLSIPGLTEEKATQIKNIIINKLRNV